MEPKILCIQLRQIGDVLMTTPAVRALAKQYPKSQIHFLTEPPSNQIYEFNPYVHRIIKVSRKPKLKDWFTLIKSLRKENYDIVIDFFGHPKTALLTRLTKAPKRIGFDLRGRRSFYTHPLKAPENLDYAPLDKLHLLHALGIQSQDAQLEFFVGEADLNIAKQILKKVGVDSKRPLVSVSPVSRKEYKVWPAKNFAVICDQLIAQYQAQILFLWGPGEYHFIQEVRSHMKKESLPDYPVPTIRETVALLQSCDLHLGNDNGPMHFAISQKRPTVAVFGRPMAANWTPPNQDQHLSVEYDPGCKRVCTYPKCQLECLFDLPLSQVQASIHQQMQKVKIRD